MVVQSLEPHKDPFYPKNPNEKILGYEVPYLNVIGAALMYLVQWTRSDIAFAINLLERFSSKLTKRH